MRLPASKSNKCTNEQLCMKCMLKIPIQKQPQERLTNIYPLYYRLSTSATMPCLNLELHIENLWHTLKTNPKFRVALTRAASSGDCAWYSRTPWMKKQQIILHNSLEINTPHDDNSSKICPKLWYNRFVHNYNIIKQLSTLYTSNRSVIMAIMLRH